MTTSDNDRYQDPYADPAQPPAPPYGGYLGGGQSLVPAPHSYRPVMHVAPRSPGIAVLASFFLPGLGSMISGRGGKGAGILIAYVVSWILTTVLIGFAGVIGFWIYGMVAGANDARKWNLAHGILS